MERGWKPNVEFSPNCPRCGSSNTKFCYYNNYSLTQPRYFCKGCRRYWTKGGSLRNVPVGGGCRKNRRAKSLRLPTDGASSKNLSYVNSSNQGIAYSYGHSNESSLAYPTSSSIGQGESHIDLALVYANFLNQPPESKSNGDEISEMPCNRFDQMTQEFTRLSNTSIQDSSRIPLLEENAQAAGFLGVSDHFAGTNLSESSSDHLYFNGFESLNKGQDRVQDPTVNGEETSYGLPPLPGEDLASQENVWSSHIMVSHNPVQPTQLPLLAPDADQDTNLLLGNWNPFDLSSDDTFSGN